MLTLMAINNVAFERNTHFTRVIGSDVVLKFAVR